MDIKIMPKELIYPKRQRIPARMVKSGGASSKARPDFGKRREKTALALPISPFCLISS